MSKRQQRLGRGLEALIGTGGFSATQASGPQSTRSPGRSATGQKQHGDTVAADSASAQKAAAPGQPAAQAASPPVQTLRLDLVDPNPFQPRQQFDDTGLAELAQSIKTDGILQPIAVRPVAGRFQIIAGERRCRAARLAGLAEVPAVVRSTDDNEMLALALIENIQREDLNAIEKAQAYEQLRKALDLSIEQLAARLGQDRSTVSNYLRLLELEDSVQAWIRSGALSMGQARAILGAPAEDRHRLARHAVEQELSVRAVEKMVQLIRQGGRVQTKPEPRPVVKDLEERFTRSLGIKTRIKEGPKGKSGRLVLYYRTLDDFDRICDRLGLVVEE